MKFLGGPVVGCLSPGNSHGGRLVISTKRALGSCVHPCVLCTAAAPCWGDEPRKQITIFRMSPGWSHGLITPSTARPAPAARRLPPAPRLHRPAARHAGTHACVACTLSGPCFFLMWSLQQPPLLGDPNLSMPRKNQRASPALHHTLSVVPIARQSLRHVAYSSIAFPSSPPFPPVLCSYSYENSPVQKELHAAEIGAVAAFLTSPLASAGASGGRGDGVFFFFFFAARTHSMQALALGGGGGGMCCRGACTAAGP